MQRCCPEQSPSEALLQAFLLINTNGSLVPGFGMPTSILNYLKEELIQPQHRFLVHGQQHTLLILIINLRNSAPNGQSRKSQKSLTLSAAELWGLPLDMLEPRVGYSGSESHTRLSQRWRKEACLPHLKPNLSQPVKFCHKTCNWIISHLGVFQAPSLPWCANQCEGCLLEI